MLFTSSDTGIRPKASLEGMDVVAAGRNPLKILGTIIQFITVLVIDDLPDWARADKGLGNYYMEGHVPSVLRPILKPNVRVSIGRNVISKNVRSQGNEAGRGFATKAAYRRNAVSSLKSDYWSPLFCNLVLHGKVLLSCAMRTAVAAARPHHFTSRGSW